MARPRITNLDMADAIVDLGIDEFMKITVAVGGVLI